MGSKITRKWLWPHYQFVALIGYFISYEKQVKSYKSMYTALLPWVQVFGVTQNRGYSLMGKTRDLDGNAHGMLDERGGQRRYDIFDHLTSSKIFNLKLKKDVHLSSINYEKNGYCHVLGFVNHLALVAYTSYPMRSRCRKKIPFKAHLLQVPILGLT